MTMGLDNFYQRMLERIRQLRRERTEHEEILAFFNKVLAAQREAQKETTVPEIDLTAGQVKLKVDEGFPLMERENFPVDKGGSRELFQQICQLSLEENPVLAAAGQGLLEAMDAGKLDFNRLTAAVLRSDSELVESSARKLGLEYPILQALVKLSLQPSLLETAAAVAERVALDGWRYGYCPICGAPPAVAALVGEEGGRQAVCSFCGHYWRLPRVACPFCNNEKQERLRYFYGEGEDLCRIQVCEECRGYLKVIDTRDGGDSMAISVDDIATTHLDLLAEGEGYQRRAPRLWGI